MPGRRVGGFGPPPSRTQEHIIATKSFAALGVAPDLSAALAAAGITSPFPIQSLTIPDALAGRDVCGKAETGSGKTLAFGLPVIMRTTEAKPHRPKALILVPTRELAHQVQEVLTPLAASRGLSLSAVYGGAPMDRQVKALKRGVEIVVATPGRLIDLGDRGDISMSDVEMLVLDEADRMVDMGFLPQVEWVLRRLPESHQTLLFSATLDRDVDHLVQTYVRNPARHEVMSEAPTVESMEHRFLKVHQMDKVKVASAIAQGVFRTLVFVRTKRGADRLVLQMRKEGVKAEVLHGDLTQSARQRALQKFIAGDVGILVATDVAARGLDIDGVDVVVHYDPPEDHKAYLHRSGRTARAGETGVAVSLLLWDQVAEAEKLRKRLGIRQPLVEAFSNDVRLRTLAADVWGPLDEAATGTESTAVQATHTIARRMGGGAGRRRRR
ncbi:MAG: ATP-dependent RNA helicase [uncultured Acidimicrobiales bacterium]|uniref:ATP-dependent RNA helicase n=1 Tax=uncultured Acidimicrobiales bacterium TaxID=310071 RepID=A0A6J4INZ5_9ACTN|nr:MAG: ATP-dependent RNA helicase [uncultured Acidimicrobiales bacterium]